MKKIIIIILGLSLLLGGCATALPESTATNAPVIETATPASLAPAYPNLILATTTSTQDSGLLDVLIPLFETETGYVVQTVAVGTGQALKMGEEGNADVLLVHAPSSEKTFMDNGFGKDRVLVMHNDFIIVGPASDTAQIGKAVSASDALKLIYTSGSLFVSRGDDSGTHKKELEIWKKSELAPEGQSWYLETGQGMGATLIVASEKGAYTLTDRATYLAQKENLQLDLLLEGDPPLLNIYHVITVNPAKWQNANYDGAIAFVKFITQPSIQEVIGNFGVDTFGQSLFTPDAHKTDADFGLP